MSILDIAHGPNQQVGNLQPVTLLANDLYAVSPDSTQLFIMHNSFTGEGEQGPSSISVQPTHGGTAHTIYRNATLAVAALVPMSNTALLMLIGNTVGDTSQNGLWILHTDGTGLRRVTTNSAQEYVRLDQHNVSSDGGIYVLQVNKSLLFGSLSGGAPTAFVTTALEAPTMAGWTTW